MEPKQTAALKPDVHTRLQDAWPEPLSCKELSDDLDAEYERVRLSLRALHQQGAVSMTAEWKYRAVDPEL